jgi:PAS domain S-box-containing protein
MPYKSHNQIDDTTIPKDQISQLGPEKLRQRAEEELKSKERDNLKALSPEETQVMFHELKVHQIELEMQNEELRQSQIDLDAARAHYFDFYDMAPVGYCTISQKGLILDSNLKAGNLLGTVRNELVGQRFTRFIHREDEDVFYLYRKKLFETSIPQEFYLRMLRKDLTVFWARMETALALKSDGAPICRVVIIDITAHKQAEEALRASQILLDTVVDSRINLTNDI